MTEPLQIPDNHEQELQSLNQQVSEAIETANRLDDAGDPRATEAFAELSRLEEAIASRISAQNEEGRYARRGAVRAAIRSGDRQRAEQLVKRYALEPGRDGTLLGELHELLAEEV